jgi:hypothetical protein
MTTRRPSPRVVETHPVNTVCIGLAQGNSIYSTQPAALTAGTILDTPDMPWLDHRR